MGRRSGLRLGLLLAGALLACVQTTGRAMELEEYSDEIPFVVAPSFAAEVPHTAMPTYNPVRVDWGGAVLPAGAGRPAVYVPEAVPPAMPSRVELQSYQEPTPADRAEGAGSSDGLKLGTAPEDTRLVFLRQATVLLQPGQGQFDWGIDYTWQEFTRPVTLLGGELANEHFRDRRLVVPFAVRYGVSPRVQAYVNMPVGWGHFERANPEADSYEDVLGLGDISAGLNCVLRRAHGICPDVIGSIGFSAPTGDDPYGPRLPADAALGSGFWTLQADLLFVKTYDPVVVFYGVGYRHYFEREYIGGLLAPGEEFTYNLGVGFAVNDSITFSTALLGSYLTETNFDGTGLPGSRLEPISLRCALTAITHCGRIIEPFVRFGLTPDAPDAQVGIVVTRYF